MPQRVRAKPPTRPAAGDESEFGAEAAAEQFDAVAEETPATLPPPAGETSRRPNIDKPDLMTARRDRA